MKDLESGFNEVEKRVSALMKDNAGLRKRIAELEQELSLARSEAGELRDFRGKQLRVREKIEKVLRQLEALGEPGV